MLKYLNSKPVTIQGQPYSPDLESLPKYPNEFLQQFKEYDPQTLKDKGKHHKVYSIHLYKSHYNPEMY